MGIADDTPQRGYCIYAHQNKTNDKVYVGISKNVKARWESKEKRYKRCKKIYNAFLKYGWDGFDHIVLWDNLTLEEACKQERGMIRMLKIVGLSYNIADGGEGVSGREYSQEERQKMAERMKNRIVSAETKQRCKEAQRKLHGKTVYAFDMKTKEFLKSYNSIAEAAEKLGTTYCCIKRAASGKVPTSKGFIWSFTPTINPLNPKYDQAKYQLTEVYCYDFNGILVKKYNNTVEAAKEVKGGTEAITRCCNKKILTYKGFIWRKTNEPIDEEVLIKTRKRIKNEAN